MKWIGTFKNCLVGGSQQQTHDAEERGSTCGSNSVKAAPTETTLIKKIFNPTIVQQKDTCVDNALGGSQEMEQITSLWNKTDLWMAWASMLLVAVAVALEVQTVSVYSTFATSDFDQMSLLSALSVVKAVMYIATRPVMAKFADVLGRFESILMSVVLFTIGFIMLAASPNIGTYFAAHIFYVFGQVGIQFMEQVFAADTSDLKNRMFFVILPNICYLFVPWCSAPITNAIIKHSTWHWGYGMWCIIVPVVSIPVLTIMFRHKMKARALGMQCGKSVRNMKETLLQFDLVGLILFTGHRTLITGCIFVGLYSLAFYIYYPYYYPWLLVCKGLSVTAATNTSVTFTVASTAASIGAAALIRYTKRIKPIIVAGGFVYILGLGLTYHYRQPDHSLAQFIAAQAVEGVGSGMLQSPTLVLIQSVVNHNQVVSATAIFYSSISVGTVIGDAISGSMYRQSYPKQLTEYAPFLSEADIHKMVNDVRAPLKYAWGSPERVAVIEAFNHVYRKMLYGPLVVAGVMILISFTMPNQRVKGVVFGKSDKPADGEKNPVSNQCPCDILPTDNSSQDGDFEKSESVVSKTIHNEQKI
ncbi:major facilitator superfamily domain-containing protein [Yarrowia lipolytica]|nr:major facilitator superfamily domain-containing protein [Yarrowia lipolytica]KAE8173586.1 major facilitator superfamily domain-containing protein [Yarrowia lipolytica]KAJ8055511.1 major facilitator superfamily domain-containing protein [Yarrowia lipolytica]RMJ00303.1 major facilitator superfamily domain-containing protein [Yarrowia lipolytica]